MEPDGNRHGRIVEIIVMGLSTPSCRSADDAVDDLPCFMLPSTSAVTCDHRISGERDGSVPRMDFGLRQLFLLIIPVFVQLPHNFSHLPITKRVHPSRILATSRQAKCLPEVLISLLSSVRHLSKLGPPVFSAGRTRFRFNRL